eukprot:Skav235980  [mRNA]  locus=scaffold592:269765:270413:- [translate_table: standard]
MSVKVEKKKKRKKKKKNRKKRKKRRFENSCKFTPWSKRDSSHSFTPCGWLSACGKGVIVLCDSWVAIDTFIKGSSQLSDWKKLLLAMEQVDATLKSFQWFARVPSVSNAADPPSRGSLEEIAFLGEFFEQEWASNHANRKN